MNKKYIDKLYRLVLELRELVYKDTNNIYIQGAVSYLVGYVEAIVDEPLDSLKVKETTHNSEEVGNEPFSGYEVGDDNL